MTAFQALYIHWNKLKTRPEVEIVLSVPVEYADTVYQVLGGMPNPAEEVWVGVARLDTKVGHRQGEGIPEDTSSPPTTAGAHSTATIVEDLTPQPGSATARPAPVSTQYTKEAAIHIADIRFRKWMMRHYGIIDEPAATKAKIYELLNVGSLKEIQPDTEALTMWNFIMSTYLAETRIY